MCGGQGGRVKTNSVYCVMTQSMSKDLACACVCREAACARKAVADKETFLTKEGLGQESAMTGEGNDLILLRVPSVEQLDATSRRGRVPA